ncbi:Uncharacterised protein [Streptococcus pyogenes]|nr:Uncharacterised protein [Streptococcus pyogenes]VHF43607.1 Uncharacterised protein [Streptococcus pyogenes]
MGEWIEIAFIFGRIMFFNESHPSWVSGLKYLS